MSGRSGLRRCLVGARLLAGAWRLHGVAQSLARGVSLPEARALLAARDAAVDGAPPEAAIWAAKWAGRIGRRLFGRLDTCLVRALVAGNLIRGDAEVAVCVGVHRPWPTGDLLDAHAWLNVDGDALAAGEPGPNPFETVLTLPLHTRS